MKQKNKRKGLAFLGMLVLAACLLLGYAKPGSEPITSLAQLNEPGRKIGMGDDTNDDKLVAERLPQAEDRIL